MSITAGLYGITDASQTADPIAWGAALVEAGCPTLQLRAKAWSQADILLAAKALRVITRKFGATFIVNDHPEIAAEVEADGVHVGQDDLAIQAARNILGGAAIIGLSTHTIDQARAARGVDYIGFGPIFSTSTKENAGSPRGVEQLSHAVDAASVPVVAIGGIMPSNVAAVHASGAHAWAMVSGLNRFSSAREAVIAAHPQP